MYLHPTCTYPYVWFLPQAIRLILVLLYLPCYLCNFPPLAEVDQTFAVSLQEIWVALFNEQDV